MLFTQNCASCHTLAAAGASGKVGPNLDDSFRGPREQGFAESTVRDVVRTQIAEAILPMPKNLVTGSDADDVAAYVAAVAGVPAPGAGVTSTTSTAPSQTVPTTTAETTTAETTTAETTTAATTTAPTTTEAGGGGDAAKGEALFTSLGCAGCHSIDGATGVGPTMKGLSGSKVTLTDGSTVTADEAFLLESIFDPDKAIEQGFAPGIMSGTIKPGSVSQADAKALVAYIESLK